MRTSDCVNHARWEGCDGRKAAQRIWRPRQLVTKFPAYEEILSQPAPIAVLLDRRSFASSIERVRQFSEDKEFPINLSLSKKEMKISSSLAERGESTDLIETAYDGDPITVNLNAQYLLSILHTITTETISLGLKDELSPVLLSPVDLFDRDRYFLAARRV